LRRPKLPHSEDFGSPVVPKKSVALHDTPSFT
jgi:hypothetical protein